jgi:hypothetical protein
MVRAALYSIFFFGLTIVQIYKIFFCEKETAAWTIFFVELNLPTVGGLTNDQPPFRRDSVPLQLLFT